QPFLIKQLGLRRDDLSAGVGREKFVEQSSCRFSPQRFNGLKATLGTNTLNPHPVFIEKNVPKYDVGEAVHRQGARHALEFLFVGFPRSSTAHERETEEACLPSKHLRAQAMRSAACSIFGKHRYKRLHIKNPGGPMQSQIAVLASAP